MIFPVLLAGYKMKYIYSRYRNLSHTEENENENFKLLLFAI